MKAQLRFALLLDSDVCYQFGDPRPLAVLEPVPRNHYREAKKAAQTWAKTHPEASGYITMPMRDSGFWFFTVERGHAENTGASSVLPRFFAAADED